MRVRSVRPWEAVWESEVLIGLSRTPAEAMHSAEDRTASPAVRERPWESDTASHGLTDRTLKSVRPCESDHGLSPQSHVICLRVRARPLTASQIWESDRPLTHTGRSDSRPSNAFSREISQTGPRMTASPGVRERPIGLYRPKQCV